MRPRVLIATANEGKKKGLLTFWKELEIDWLSLKDFPPIAEPAETGETYTANAEIKARAYGQAHGQLTVAEDSGVEIAALPGMFGLRTRRQLTASSDMDWLTQFLALMAEQTDRRATFYSAISLYDPSTDACHTVLGSCHGQIVDFPQAPIEKGIPIAAVFVPEGQEEVFSALSPDAKRDVSHRGLSAGQMVPHLLSILKK